MSIKRDMELRDKGTPGVSHPAEEGGNRREDGEPQDDQVPTKRTKSQTIILMATLCVSQSELFNDTIYARLSLIYASTDDSLPRCPRHYDRLHSLTDNFRPLPFDIRVCLDWIGLSLGRCRCSTVVGEIQ